MGWRGRVGLGFRGICGMECGDLAWDLGTSRSRSLIPLSCASAGPGDQWGAWASSPPSAAAPIPRRRHPPPPPRASPWRALTACDGSLKGKDQTLVWNLVRIILTHPKIFIAILRFLSKGGILCEITLENISFS